MALIPHGWCPYRKGRSGHRCAWRDGQGRRRPPPGPGREAWEPPLSTPGSWTPSPGPRHEKRLLSRPPRPRPQPDHLGHVPAAPSFPLTGNVTTRCPPKQVMAGGGGVKDAERAGFATCVTVLLPVSGARRPQRLACSSHAGWAPTAPLTGEGGRADTPGLGVHCLLPGDTEMQTDSCGLCWGTLVCFRQRPGHGHRTTG